MLEHSLSNLTLSEDRRENTPVTALVTLPAFYIQKRWSTHDWVRQRTSCGPAHKPKCVWKGQNQRTPCRGRACPCLLVEAFDQCSALGKRNWNQALKPACQPFCAIHLQAPLEQESMSLLPLRAGPQHSSQHSHNMYLKCWSHHLTREALLFQSITENLQDL